MRTKDEIDAEAARLEAMKPTVRKCSGFGDNHHNAIDAQVQVLREGMSNDDIFDAWGDEEIDEFEQNVLDAAIQAQDWMRGDTDEAPSVEWQDLVQ